MISIMGANTTLEQVQKVKLQRPARAGSYWEGISHGSLTATVVAEIEKRGWKINHAKFSLSPDEADLAGAFDLTIPHAASPEGQSFALGMMTSNAMRRSLRLLVGTNIAICSNGMVTGEIVLKKKHTTRLDLADQLDQALDTYLIKAKAIPLMVQGLKSRFLLWQEAEHVLMEAGREGLMPWSRIGQVDKEYRHPRFLEHGKETSWALLNAFTWVVKKNPPLQQMDQINQFREMLPQSTPLSQGA